MGAARNSDIEGFTAISETLSQRDLLFVLTRRPARLASTSGALGHVLSGTMQLARNTLVLTARGAHFTTTIQARKLMATHRVAETEVESSLTLLGRALSRAVRSQGAPHIRPLAWRLPL